MPTRDEKLDGLLDGWWDARLEWMRTSTNTRPTFAVSDALDAIHAHVESRVAEAYHLGFEAGLRAGEVGSRFVMGAPYKPEPPQFIIAGGDSFPAAPVQATKSFASTGHFGVASTNHEGDRHD